MSHDNRIYVNTTQNNLVVIDSEQNQLTVTHPVTQVIEITQAARPTVIVTEETPNNVSVTEEIGKVINVVSLGPQGVSAPFVNLGSNNWSSTSNLQITSSVNILGSLTLNNNPVITGLFAQIANGPTVTATANELSILGAGVGTLSIPANGFQVGDSFHAKLIGHISSGNNQTLHIRIKADGVDLANTGTLSIGTTTNRQWELNIYFTIRALGAAGVASIASGGVFSYTRNSGGGTFEGTNFSMVNNTTFDTTINNTLEVTAQWGSNNASNIIYTELFMLHKTF